MEHKVHRVVVELGDGGHGGAVVGIDQGQVLHVQDLHDVGSGQRETRMT